MIAVGKRPPPARTAREIEAAALAVQELPDPQPEEDIASDHGDPGDESDSERVAGLEEEYENLCRPLPAEQQRFNEEIWKREAEKLDRGEFFEILLGPPGEIDRRSDIWKVKLFQIACIPSGEHGTTA